MKKLFTPIATLVIGLCTSNAYSQNFTAIDTLPEGAYGTAAWGDYDNDGQKDLAYLTQALPNAICKIYHNKGNVFTEIQQQLPYLYNPAAEWADLNNDGFEDLVVNGMDSLLVNRTFIYRSMGNGTFVAIPNVVFPLSSGSIAMADYNQDGLKDIAVTGMDSVAGHHAYIYKNMGGFLFKKINTPLIGVHFGELKWGDYNNDNLVDLIINGIGNTDFRARIYKNRGADSFELQPLYMKGSAGTVDFVDMNSDGWLDVLVTGYDSTSGNSFTELHHNDTNEAFSLVGTNLPDFGEPSSVAIADFSNDTKKDVCFIGGTSLSCNGAAMAIKNKIVNNYNVSCFFKGDVINAIIDEADMDNDGDYDLILGNLILRNNNLTQSGVKDIITSEEENFIIYPNPVSEILYINTLKEQNVKVQIYNSIGTCILQKELTEGTNEIDLNAFSGGLYVVRMSFNGKMVQQKLVKM